MPTYGINNSMPHREMYCLASEARPHEEIDGKLYAAHAHINQYNTNIILDEP